MTILWNPSNPKVLEEALWISGLHVQGKYLTSSHRTLPGGPNKKHGKQHDFFGGERWGKERIPYIFRVKGMDFWSILIQLLSVFLVDGISKLPGVQALEPRFFSLVDVCFIVSIYFTIFPHWQPTFWRILPWKWAFIIHPEKVAEIFDDVIEEADCIENAPVTQEIQSFVAPGAGAKIDGLGVPRMTIMTWNACAISFPLQIHPAKFLLGLLLGNWWHDSQSDAPMEIFSAAAEVRFAHQADYIRHSGADLVSQHQLGTVKKKPQTWRLWSPRNFFFSHLRITIPINPQCYQLSVFRTAQWLVLNSLIPRFVLVTLVVHLFQVICGMACFHNLKQNKPHFFFRFLGFRSCFKKFLALLCWNLWCCTWQMNLIAVICHVVQECRPSCFGRFFCWWWDVYRACFFSQSLPCGVEISVGSDGCYSAFACHSIWPYAGGTRSQPTSSLETLLDN